MSLECVSAVPFVAIERNWQKREDILKISVMSEKFRGSEPVAKRVGQRFKESVTLISLGIVVVPTEAFDRFCSEGVPGEGVASSSLMLRILSSISFPGLKVTTNFAGT